MSAINNDVLHWFSPKELALSLSRRQFDISHIAPEFRSSQSKQRLLNSILKVFARTAMHFTFVLFHFEELRRRNYWGAKLRDVERPWMCSALKIIHARGPRIPGMPNSDTKRYSRLDWLSSFRINQWVQFYFYSIIILGNLTFSHPLTFLHGRWQKIIQKGARFWNRWA